MTGPVPDVGYTRRSAGWPAMGPLRHVWTPHPASPTGRNHRALCGASILPGPMLHSISGRRVPWRANHPRACPRCRSTWRKLGH